jgi:hypothetical protein
MNVHDLPILEDYFSMGPFIGKGENGYIFRVERQGQYYAAKMPPYEVNKNVETLEGRYVTIIDTWIEQILEQATTLSKITKICESNNCTVTGAKSRKSPFPLYHGLYRTTKRIYKTTREIPVIIMELVDGETLLTGSPLDVRSFIKQVIDAIQILHNNNMVHTDLTFGNILVTPEDDLVLIDIQGVPEDFSIYDDADYELKIDLEYVDELMETTNMLDMNKIKDIYYIGRLMLYLKDLTDDSYTKKQLVKLGRTCKNKNPFLRPTINELANSFM